MKALQFSASAAKFLVLKPLGALFPSLFYKGPLATIKLVDIPEPRPARAGLGQNPNLDVRILRLRSEPDFPQDSPTASPFTSFPCVLGHELSGEIIEVGQEVTDHQVGEMVTLSPGLTCVPRGIDPLCPSCQTGRPGSCENTAKGCLSPGMFTGICKDINGGFAPTVVAHRSQIFKLAPGMTPGTGA